MPPLVRVPCLIFTIIIPYPCPVVTLYLKRILTFFAAQEFEAEEVGQLFGNGERQGAMPVKKPRKGFAGDAGRAGDGCDPVAGGADRGGAVYFGEPIHHVPAYHTF